MPWRLTAFKDFNDEHASAATGTWRNGLLDIDGNRCARRRLRRGHAKQLAGLGEVGGAHAAGEQAMVADALQALGQNVDQKAADELVRIQRHGRIAARPFNPVVLDLERDASGIG